MALQYVTDTAGNQTAVMIPIDEWELLRLKHKDLKELETTPIKPKTKLSGLAGKLSEETANAMLNYVEEGRNDWDGRLKKQF